ncbi:MAG: primosomal protein N' [Alphaproteobacteria bacterium]|nr:MAG: primosomal protein N' [Alphaproteobacteria bacterium]
MPDNDASSPADICDCSKAARRESTPGAAGRVRVLLPLPFPGALDYLAPEGAAALEPGSFVRAPLGTRSLVGVVWEGTAGELPAGRLRPLLEILTLPPLRPELRRFVERVAAYTMAPLGMVLRMTMAVAAALEPPRPRRLCALASAGCAALSGAASGTHLTAARKRVLEKLRNRPPLAVSELARLAECGPGVVRDLVRRGLLEERFAPSEPLISPAPDWRLSGSPLSPDQAAAARPLVDHVTAGGFRVIVLDGVTGSGKTETYFAALAAALAAGKQALVLLPEIALGAQWLERFCRRFGVLPAQWHSDIGEAERRDTWRAVVDGRTRVVVGARSALFLPFPELGLIIVDEEHDSSYKQEDGVIYQARDMAVLRASLAQIPIVLVSATPSLETVVNVARARYERVALPRRHAAAELPAVRLVDMRRERIEPARFLAPPLVAELAATFEAGQQALLFLNRRGYAPLTLCRACGHRFHCPSCTAWLVEHRFTRRLLCHHCGHAEAVPPVCPECLAAGALVPCGPGVERLLEEVTARFPAARAALMVSDLLSGPRAAAQLAQAMTERRYDVLIGTQIVAKGHHFPMLTLVGVVDADLGLTGGDLRAAERTYQLLHQVGGRAGRAEHKGRVLIQTFMPDQPVMQALASGDRDRFLQAEAAARRHAGLPPFGRLAAVIVSAADAETCDFTARALARAAPQLPGVTVLGPAPAPLAILRGRHRQRFLVKATREVRLQAILRDWLSRVRTAGSARIQVDIDPYSFL